MPKQLRVTQITEPDYKCEIWWICRITELSSDSNTNLKEKKESRGWGYYMNMMIRVMILHQKDIYEMVMILHKHDDMGDDTTDVSECGATTWTRGWGWWFYINMMLRVMIPHEHRGLVEHLNRISTLEKKKYTESVVKSQNIVEQANSNPNNISPTISRRHIICKSVFFFFPVTREF